MKIKQGKIPTAIRAVIYGSEGIGKTTLASKFPYPVFFDLEAGSNQLDVERADVRWSWESLLEAVQAVDDCGYKTLVIDTADKAEIFCAEYVCSKFKKAGIEDFGFGKGYAYLAEEFGKLLAFLNNLYEHGMNVVLVSHAKMRKFEQPDEQGAYDRWELKLTKQVAPLVKEWCDLLLFLNYKTMVVKTDTAIKAQGGKRVMYAAHHPCWDAKNRFDLPSEMDVDIKELQKLFSQDAAKPVEPVNAPFTNENLAKIVELCKEAKVTEEEVARTTAKSSKGKLLEDIKLQDIPDGYLEWIIRNWDKLVNKIEEQRVELPFI